MWLCCVSWWWKVEGETRCRLIACSRKALRGPPGFNIPIRRTNRYQQHFSIYILAIRKCTLAPRLKIFKWKFTTSPGIEPRTPWTRGRHASIWASSASYLINVAIWNTWLSSWYIFFECKLDGGMSLRRDLGRDDRSCLLALHRAPFVIQIMQKAYQHGSLRTASFPLFSNKQFSCCCLL